MFTALVCYICIILSTQTQYSDSEPQQSEDKHVTPHRHNILIQSHQIVVALNQDNVSVWSDMFTLRLLWLWIRILCLCGVTCLPSDCCGSESGYCVCVEWHVYPQITVALNQYNVSVWSDMFTLRLLWLWIRILCLWSDMFTLKTAVALNQDNVSVWSDMFTLGMLWLWIRILCLCGVTCLPHRHNILIQSHSSLRVNMSLHTDTLYWFRATAVWG
jgi:hypothetical protein